MLDIKIFEGGSGTIELEIRKWMEDNKDLQIHRMIQSESSYEKLKSVTITFLYNNDYLVRCDDCQKSFKEKERPGELQSRKVRCTF